VKALIRHQRPLTAAQKARVARDDLVPVAELPAIFHHYGGMIDLWIETGALPSVTIDDTRYVRRAVLDETFATSRWVADEMNAIAAGGEPYTAEQISMVRRVLGKALADW
jgi:hypothetical protein